MDLDVQRAERARWGDLCDLFGPSGTYRGCWCMTWRISDAAFRSNGNAGNRAALEARVGAGEQVGLLGYRDGVPVAWCSVAPRPGFPKILSSTTIAPSPPDEAEDSRIWSVVCFFVRAGHRRQRLMDPMLAAAVTLAREERATAIEGYPVDLENGNRRGAIYTGTIQLYERHGFYEHRRPPRGRRVVMRRSLTVSA